MDRRLAAILMADVVGYSRLMSEDEAGTLERLKVCRRDIIDPAIAKFHGRIIKLMGDGALVEFASIVDAVECAAAIQRDLAAPGPGAAGVARIQLRIGINLGDIIVEGDDLYGDGVNIAARLEAMAEPGGICVSGTAYDHAVHKASVGFQGLGELRLKNIPDPVRAYRVVLNSSVTSRPAGKRLPIRGAAIVAGVAGLLLAAATAFVFFGAGPGIPARPSLAVLPFANLAAGESDSYFADGITEDLTTELAKLSAVDVIARNSTFQYKDKPVTPSDVARDLGVRYIVEGSVRRTGDGIRVNAQLVDATKGDLLWAEKYDRKSADVFAIQDEIVGAIIANLGIKPTVSEAEGLARLPTSNLEAYDNFLRGEQAERSGLRPQLRKALEFYIRAEELDPKFADAFAADARASAFIWRNTYDDVLLTPVAKKRAYEMASRALELNPRASGPYASLAVLQAVDGQHEQALASARRSVALGPSSVDAQIALGFVLTAAGKHAEAAAAIETAERLDPNLSAADRQVAGLVYFLNGNPDEAIETLELARAESPELDDIHILLAAAYAKAGRLDDARKAVAEILRLSPGLCVAYLRMGNSYLRSAEDRETFSAAMAKAGLPVWPYDFRGDEKSRLSGEEISRLVFGHTLQGRVYSGSPAIMQVGRDSTMAFRSATLMISGKAFVSDGMLCQVSNSLAALGRADCGPVYRRNDHGVEPAYAYVNGTNVFYFSPID